MTDWKALADAERAKLDRDWAKLGQVIRTAPYAIFGAMTAMAMGLSAIGWLLAWSTDPNAIVMGVGCAIFAAVLGCAVAGFAWLDGHLFGED